MINHGISLNKRVNYHLDREFVNVMCTTSNKTVNQYKYPTVCPAGGFVVDGFPMVQIFEDHYELFNFDDKDYFLFPISQNKTTPTEATYGISAHAEQPHWKDNNIEYISGNTQLGQVFIQKYGLHV